MELIDSKREGKLVTLTFKETYEAVEIKRMVTINQPLLNFDTEEGGPHWFSIGEIHPFPYSIKEDFSSIPLHMPDAMTQKIFIEIINAIEKYHKAPIHVTKIEQPGYKVLSLNYNHEILHKDDMLNLIHESVASIHLMEVEETEIEREEVEEEEDFDEVDEDVIVEYDLDDDLKELMHEPDEEEIQPLKEDEETDD